jgi:hypothetical protein
MRQQEVRELYEAYMQVHQPQEVVEEIEELDEDDKSYDRNRRRAAQRAAARNEARKQGKTGAVPGVGYVTPRRERETYRDSAGVERHTSGARMPQKEEVDLYDTILEHLVAEGYADTEESALAIMANMSEEWKQSILDEEKKELPQTKMYRKAGELARSGIATGDEGKKKRSAKIVSAITRETERKRFDEIGKSPKHN